MSDFAPLGTPRLICRYTNVEIYGIQPIETKEKRAK
jgi:hypothetical protein